MVGVSGEGKLYARFIINKPPGALRSIDNRQLQNQDGEISPSDKFRPRDQHGAFPRLQTGSYLQSKCMGSWLQTVIVGHRNLLKQALIE